jgi:hypothetical protein
MAGLDYAFLKMKSIVALQIIVGLLNTENQQIPTDRGNQFRRN